MFKWVKIILAIFALGFIGILFLRRSSVELVTNGKVVAVVRRPVVMPWEAAQADVYAGQTKLFALREGIFEYPLFIHPFPDHERFLCIYDDDVAVLVFVVHIGPQGKHAGISSSWPPNKRLQTLLAERATFTVRDATGFVRLPTVSEVEEVSALLARLTVAQFRASALPVFDAGVFQMYPPRDFLIRALDSNRHAYWP